MAMSDCIKCWDTPCTCGWDYRDYTKSRRMELAAKIVGIPKGLFVSLLLKHVPDDHPMKEV